MRRFKLFTGGVLDTNCFLLDSPEGKILFDAPQGADAFFADDRIALLLITHGHFDHIADAAAIQRRHQCQVGFHPETAPMTADANYFRQFGFELEIAPFRGDLLIEEGPQTFLGDAFQVYYVPGHCPGSLCFYLPSEKTLIGGDVLFRGGIGRWDLPGGNKDLLVTGIRNKLLKLPKPTVVLPGHGPQTTIGREEGENLFLQV